MKKVFLSLFLAMTISFAMSQSYSITNYTTSNSSIVSNDILSVQGTSTGAVWFGSNGSGASKLVGSTWTTYTTSQGLGSNTVKGIIEDHLGNIWFATTGGVTKYTGSTWTTYDTGDGLPVNDVKCVFEDISNNIWVGTGGGGVAKDNGSSWTTYDDGDGLAQNFVQAITQDQGGDMWFATADGVSRFNGTSTWTTYTSSNGLVSNGNEVISGCCDPDGNVWFGSKPGFGIGGGVSMYNGSSWTTWQSAPGGLANNQVMGIASDAKSRMWFATYVNGVSFLKNLSSWSTYGTPHGLVSNTLQCVDVAPDGYVWVGSTGGVSRIATLIFQSTEITHNTCGAICDAQTIIHAGTITSMLYYSFDDGSSYQAANFQDGMCTGTYDLWITDSSMFIEIPGIDVLDIPEGDAFPFDSMSVCFADTFQLNPGSNFSDFLWAPDSILSNDTATNPFIYPFSSQWLEIDYLDSSGCNISDFIYLDVLPQIVFNVNVTDDSVFTVDNTFSSYQWYRYGSPISGATAQTYTADQPGNYTVCVTNTEGCDACSGMIPYMNAGIEETSILVHAYISDNVLYYDIPESFNKIEVFSYDGRILEVMECEGGQSFVVLQNNTSGALIIRFSNESSYSVKSLYR